MVPHAPTNDPPTSAGLPLVSVVVPAWNEAENLPLLVPRIDAALAGVAYEVVVVDDGSRDGTPAACAALAGRYPVTLIVRDAPEHGLSGAVLRGIAAARGRTIVVMDADLQHPPERLPALLSALDGGADFALGSRYVAGGSTDGHWSAFRKVNSWVATVLARPFAGPVRDPMSGFFALRRSTLDRAQRLTPLGYKIALELMCKCRVRRVVEVPIHFGLRTRGRSKLTLAQQFRYLEHLSRLYDFTFPRASPIGKFGVTVAAGFTVGLLLYTAARAAGAGATAGVCRRVRRRRGRDDAVPRPVRPHPAGVPAHPPAVGRLRPDRRRRVRRRRRHRRVARPPRPRRPGVGVLRRLLRRRRRRPVRPAEGTTSRRPRPATGPSEPTT